MCLVWVCVWWRRWPLEPLPLVRYVICWMEHVVVLVVLEWCTVVSCWSVGAVTLLVFVGSEVCELDDVGVVVASLVGWVLTPVWLRVVALKVDVLVVVVVVF